MHKTVYVMRMSDWSSYVGSSDLGLDDLRPVADVHDEQQRQHDADDEPDRAVQPEGEAGEKRDEQQCRHRLQDVDQAFDEEPEDAGDEIEEPGGVGVQEVEEVDDPDDQRSLVLL